MFFKQLEIHNFRGIDSLKIDNIKQVNLITGKNNCGKTSVLEAIFLLTGMSNPQLTVNIHSFRNLFLTDDGEFSYIFKNFDFSQFPSIVGQLDSQKRTLEIKVMQISKHELSKKDFIPSTSTDKTDRIEGLIFAFNINEKDFFQSEIKLKQGEIKLSREYRENLIASFINPQTIMNDLSHRLDAILVRKDLGTIVNALKEIEPNLIDIRMGARGMVYADIGIDTLVPINMMGDGIRRILAILAAISERKNSIILIDEIENGLHYSTLFVLWKAILKIAFDSNIQLFITTHSYECIEAITKIYKDKILNLENNSISLFRIDRNNNGQHRAFQYEMDTLLAGIEKEFEVR